MRTILERSPHESSFSFSKRHFQWIIGKGGGGEERKRADGEGEEEFLAFSIPSSSVCDDDAAAAAAPPAARKKGASSAAVAVSRFRSVLTAAIARMHRPARLGPHVTGTLFGHRRGHVHFAFQVDSRSCPAVLIELATPTSALVREMASGLVRIALECKRRGSGGGRKAAVAGKLVEEPLWRAYCNEKKYGYAVRRQCGPADWKVLRAVEPVSMGAGVLPGDGSPEGQEGDDGSWTSRLKGICAGVEGGGRTERDVAAGRMRARATKAAKEFFICYFFFKKNKYYRRFKADEFLSVGKSKSSSTL